MWTYFKLSSLEKDWYSLQNFPYVVVNIRLILGNVWLKGYTWWNARIFQRPPQKKKKKFLCGNGKNDWCDFLFSLNLKFKNKPGNDYSDLSPSCWIVTEQNLKTQNKPKRKQTNKTTKEQQQKKTTLAFTIQKFFEVYLWENCLLCSHGEVNWHSLSSQHRLVC